MQEIWKEVTFDRDYEVSNLGNFRRKDLYVNSISEVERITGITFFPSLSKELANDVKSQANIKDWDRDLFKWR